MRYVLWIVCSSILLVNCEKQNNGPEPEGITFIKTFNLGLYEDGNSVIQTSDYGYAVLGTTNSREGGGNDLLFIKTDSLGNSQWAWLYGGDQNDRGYSVRQTLDGGYILTGLTTAAGNVDSDVYLVKTDAAGIEQWHRVFGDTIYYDEGRTVMLSQDGGYVVAGNGTVNNESGIILIKTDGSGNEQWYKIFSEDYCIQCFSASPTADGGYVLIGTSYYGDNKVVLIKTDSLGNQVWYKTFSVTGFADGRAVKQTSDGGYIMTGTTGTSATEIPDVFLIKLNSAGNHQWTKTLVSSQYDASYSLEIANDGGYVVVGETFSGQPGKNLYFVKTDALGIQEWAYTIGRDYDDWGTSISRTIDGGYIMTGAKGIIYGIDVDVYLIKTDVNGLIQTE